jgi:uncharacterized protein involved in response to NO
MQEETTNKHITVTHTGFRPFFFVATLFAIVTMTLWLSITTNYSNPLVMNHLHPAIWHAHEMIYGYAMAVIAGFLLTAVRNWTREKTLSGLPLMLLALLWLLPRLLPYNAHPLAMPAMATLDLIFNISLCLAVLQPILKAGQHKHLGIWTLLVLLTLGNLLFYLGLLEILDNGIRLGLYSGLYLVISLILILSRRVMPMFIQNGVGYPVTLTNRRWLDIASLILMPIFIVADVFLSIDSVTAVTASVLGLLHAIRMMGWHTKGIWKKPLLWVLYLAYAWITLGFIITAASYSLGIDAILAIHAFAYGGIGLMTIGMMARVTLGHTGRDLSRPPAILVWVFGLLFVGSILRVIMPAVFPTGSTLWITSSLIIWIFAFCIFALTYSPMLIRARIDGRSG